MSIRYECNLDDTEIAIGNFYNGVALVYVGYSQKRISDRYDIENKLSAQIAINTAGEFIKFNLTKGHEYYGFETYNKNSNTTLVRFELRRAKNVIKKGTFSTDVFDFYNGYNFSKDDYELSDDVFCLCEVTKGEITPRTKPIHEYIDEHPLDDPCYVQDEYDLELDEYYEDINDYKTIISDTFFVQFWGCSRPIHKSINLGTVNNTLYVIKDRYILLYDNIRNYMSDEYHTYGETDTFSFSYCDLFKRYNIPHTDIEKNRYGVFDISSKRTIIHVGEMGYVEALISGFIRLDFLDTQEIITFDYFDIKAGKGIPYKPELSGFNKAETLVTSCIDGHEYKRAVNRITEYWSIPETRTGLNTGQWYIVREGKNAGRSLCWLLANGKIKDVINMINSAYLSFDNFSHFTYPSSFQKKQRDEIWLALDKHKIFEKINAPDDVLKLEEPFSRYSLTKHQSLASDDWGNEEPCFEELIDIDTDYLIGLIDNHSLLIDDNVLEELERSYGGNVSYLSKLSKVREANAGYIEEINDYEQRWKDEIQAQWEDEERRYWENEGYRSAYEDGPDAIWNND